MKPEVPRMRRFFLSGKIAVVFAAIFAGRLEDIVARDAAEREEKEWQKTA